MSPACPQERASPASCSRTDWQKDYGLPIDAVKGGLCCSGMYDLYPVSLSARSSYVKFTPEVIEALSSLRHLDNWQHP